MHLAITCTMTTIDSDLFIPACWCSDDGEAAGPLLTTSVPPESNALASAPWQAPVMLPALRMLAPIMSLQQQQLDAPEASVLDKADSSGGSHGLAPAKQQQWNAAAAAGGAVAPAARGSMFRQARRDRANGRVVISR
jgi:hypothetical protein